MAQRGISNSRRETWEDPLARLSRLANRLHTLRLAWTYPFTSIGKGTWVHRSCELRRSIAEYISIGDFVFLERNVWINIAEIPDGNKAVIILEDGCKLQRGCVISAKNRIHVERNTIFGPLVFVTDHNHAFEDVTVPIAHQGPTQGGTIRIEEGCWIGFGAAIVCTHGNLVIGRNSVVGANSVVSRSVPPYSVVTGNPARTAKHYDPLHQKWVLGAGIPTGH
jgi:acetyltransferase-like isoleucine patch superfamily enzyme